MIISKSKKVAYIGIPHTGSSLFHQHIATAMGYPPKLHGITLRPNGTCICTNDVFIDDVDLKHSPLKEMREYADRKLQISNEEFDSEFTVFCVVKHPTKWLLSDWDIGRRANEKFKEMTDEEIHESTRNKAQAEWAINLREHPHLVHVPFLESVKLVCEEGVRENKDSPSIYLPYLNSSAGSIETLKFEDFAETYTTISNAFGFQPPDFGYVVNPSTYNQEEVCETSKGMVYERYIYDFKRFGYEREF